MTLAFRVLGLRPWEFWRLTLYELRLMVEAGRAREDGERRFLAAMTANLMNCWRSSKSDPVTVDALLGIAKPGERQRGPAWLRKPLREMTPAQRKRLQSCLEERRAKREAMVDGRRSEPVPSGAEGADGQGVTPPAES